MNGITLEEFAETYESFVRVLAVQIANLKKTNNNLQEKIHSLENELKSLTPAEQEDGLSGLSDEAKEIAREAQGIIQKTT